MKPAQEKPPKLPPSRPTCSAGRSLRSPAAFSPSLFVSTTETKSQGALKQMPSNIVEEAEALIVDACTNHWYIAIHDSIPFPLPNP